MKLIEPLPNLSGLGVLVLDSDQALLGEMRQVLTAYGAEVFGVGAPDEARSVIMRRPIDAFLAGFTTMGERPEDLISLYMERNPDGLCYLLMEGDTVVMASDPSALLVEDYLQKPVDPARFARMLDAAKTGGIARSTALEIADPVIRKTRPYFSFRSPAMRRALRDLPRIAASDRTVLISGETGTGKEIISHAIHVMSPRALGPIIAINCGAIPEGLIEGELFGHERGAFTGAQSARRGKFEAADGGTLLLDEIGDMPLSLQMRLLRVLEEGRVYRIGSHEPRPINVRIIAATLRDLSGEVRRGLFREDLYYRLNVLRIHLPPLRERPEDISLLAVHFLDRSFQEMGMRPPYPALATSTVELLEGLPWRGNVRELRNAMTRVAVLLPRGARQVLPMHVLPHVERTPISPPPEQPSVDMPEGREGGVPIPDDASLADAELLLIDRALALSGGNRTLAARRLGIGLRTLRRKLNLK